MKDLVFLLLLLFIAQPSAAEIYKWTDEQGQIHFSDEKPENQESKEVELEIRTYESVSYEDLSNEPSKVEPAKADARKKVVMYSASWCGTCKKAKKYFRRNGIPFTNYDIEKSSRAKKLYEQLGASGVPVIIVGKKRMNGFSEAGFQRIYK
jgi:glutaredoxin